MSAKIAKMTLKSLQNEMNEKISILTEELNNVKKELTDVKEEHEICRNGSVNSYNQNDKSDKLSCNECDKSFREKKI